MALEVGRDERAHGDEVGAGGADVFERAVDERGREAGGVEARVDVGVDEHGRARLQAVANLAGELAVDPELVPELARVVGDRDLAHSDCGSTSTTAVSPARRIAGAAAESRRAACEA